ncbi:pyrroline-5-carboxylate reductase dimerization domain-containing protein [Methanobacterium oryzae]|uniref:pyrroline-5-carboxylate reductase dimerization domain-containing protein n=1 Tax=Methanobacterium oryzae TaxID=69540 RepID=UPI003D2562F4
MIKIGFIGYGSMGSMIINRLLSKKALNEDQIIISTRTKSKLGSLKKEYPQIEITDNNQYLSSKCEKIFLFVGTSTVKEVIEDIMVNISGESHIIYIAAALTIENVESIFKGKITKFIPSLTSEVAEGISLICHNEKVTKNEAEFVNNLFNSISTVKIIEEDDFEIGSDLTSCSPAFIAKIFMEFAKKGAKNSNISRKEAEDMVIKTFYGTAKLLHDENMSFEELISRVATKGGITEEGVKVLDKSLPPIFDELFKTTQIKYEIIKEELNKEYNTN